MKLYLIAVLALLPVRAYAGACETPADAEADMKSIETAAKSTKATKLTATEVACVTLGAEPFAKRIEAACSKILERDAANAMCITISAAAGLAKVGTHDIVAALIARTEDPLDVKMRGFNKPELLAATEDPRGAAPLVETWKATIPLAAKKKKRASEWASWRVFTADALGVLGGAAEKTFLEEQLTITKEKGVKKAIQKAITAIAGRSP
jgi:hypothetical protein